MIKRIVEFFFFIQVVLSATAGGGILGGILYLVTGKQFTFTWICGLGLGFIAGIIWATRIRKKQPVSSFMARVIATPELDKQDDEPKKE
jgi:hypothetical protein